MGTLGDHVYHLPTLPLIPSPRPQTNADRHRYLRRPQSVQSINPCQSVIQTSHPANNAQYQKNIYIYLDNHFTFAP
jgi:hypothetical protein